MGSTATAEIAKMLGSIHDRDHYSVVRDFFELSAISIRNVVDYGKDHKSLENRYMDVARSYSKPQLEEFSRALGLLAGEIGKAVQGSRESPCGCRKPEGGRRAEDARNKAQSREKWAILSILGQNLRNFCKKNA